MELLDLVLPRRCAVCRELGPPLCEPCRRSLPRLPPPLCERCGAPTVWPVRRCAECAGRRLAFASARAAVAYDAGARSFVRAWKDGGQRALADAAAELVVECVARPAGQVLVPVPADPDRGIRRGHHPAARLAAGLAARWEVPLLDALRRTEGRRPQRGLPLSERRRNLAGAIEARRPVPARVALVDDVYTSGATATTAASALRSTGARRVEVVTFARTVR